MNSVHTQTFTETTIEISTTIAAELSSSSQLTPALHSGCKHQTVNNISSEAAQGG